MINPINETNRRIKRAIEPITEQTKPNTFEDANLRLLKFIVNEKRKKTFPLKNKIHSNPINTDKAEKVAKKIMH